jgi:predicted RNA binding protein YcfA (HicA-like mRNA interferase family)
MSAARLPVVSGKRVVRALTKAGFVVDRIAGSHHILAHPSDPTRAVTVPATPRAT